MKKLKLLFLLTAFLVCWQSYGQISGTVFADYNANGARTTANPAEPLLSGVVVTAYNAAGTVLASYTTTLGTATSATYPYTGPNFSIPASGTAYDGTPGSNTGFVPSGTNVRLEFVSGSSTCGASSFDPPSRNGIANGTSVQFVTAGAAATANYAVNNPADYNTGPANASLFLPVYVSGRNNSAMYGFPYNSTSEITQTMGGSASGSVFGACWGVAYSKQAKKLFTSAILKRQTGLGQMGVGGIYILEPTATSFNVTQFFDMDNNSFNTTGTPVTRVSAVGLAGAPAYGTGSSFSLNAGNTLVTYLGSNDPLTGKPAGLGVVGTNVQRGLSSSMTTPSFDPAAFDQVGKVGIGDIDISDDGKFLFVMNLYQRKVFRLELNDAYNPTAVISVTSYSLPTVTTTNGELRPWATKFSKGKLYVGAIASGEYESTNTNANLSAFVFELNDATGAASFNATPVLNYPLNYTKGFANTGFSTSNKWYPWNSDISRVPVKSVPAGSGISVPTPVLSDIEVNERGDLIMSFSDRIGHQFFDYNYQFLGGTTTTLVFVSVGGDILIAGKDCFATGYTIENNGAITSNSVSFSSGSANGQGLGGSEFFTGEDYAGVHQETSQGAMALLPGSSNVVLTSADPNGFNTGGVQKLFTNNGSAVSGSQLVLYSLSAGLANKGNGLGDLELVTPEAPLEIGNRVWMDTDNDGVQDADEMGLDGIPVKLYNGATLIATKTTVNGGQYYFGTADGLLPNTTYTVRIEAAGFPSGKFVTLKDQPTGGVQDLGDNDASLVGGNAEITYTTGNLGENNHTLDFGFSSSATCSSSITATPGVCNPANNQYTLAGQVTLTNPPATGTVTVQIVGGGSQSFSLPQASPISYSIAGQIADGISHTVNVTISGATCSGTIAFVAPPNCAANCPSPNCVPLKSKKVIQN